MKNKVITAVLALLLLLFLGGSLFYILVPFLADTYLLPRVVRSLPFDEKKVSLSRITPWRMQGTLAFAHQGQENFSIASVEANYSPTSLINGRIFSVTIDSALLHIDKAGNNLSLPGLPQFPSDTGAPKYAEVPVLPLAVEKIELKNSMIVVHEDDQTIQLVVNGVVLPRYEQSSTFVHQLKALTMNFSTAGAIDLEGSIIAQQEENGHRVSLELKMMDIGRQFAHLDIQQKERATGQLFVRGNMWTEGLQSIAGYDIIAELRDFSFKKGELILQNETHEVPVTLRLHGDMLQADYEVAGLELLQPEQCSLRLNGQYTLAEKEVHGNIYLLPARTKAAVDVNFHGSLGEKSVINYLIKGEQFALASGINAAPFTAKGAVQLESGAIAMKLEAKLPQITDTKNDITLADISLELPFNHPPLAQGIIIPGNIVIGEIRYKGEPSATLKGSMSIGMNQAQLSAQITSPFFENFKLTCSGEATAPNDFNLQCSFPDFSIDSAHFPKYISLPEDLQIAGIIGGEMRFAVTSGVSEGDARITSKGVNISFNDFNLTGLSGSVLFPRLPDIISSPSQLFTIDQIRMGKIVMSDAKVALRIDEKNVVFIEKARLNWCGGLVEAGAVKLFEGMEKIETTLYCDRLHYTDLLSQFGIGDAEGGGSLNGRLPVIISGDGIEFDNGFLFSTPGNSGIVRFKNTQKLRQGMTGMGRTVYLDYSMDALENFSYNWTKLTFNTEGEELLLQLQLDGKPAEPLPYGYQEGQIARSSEGGGIQHPIRLDVNFRLPMRELFRYGKSIQSFMENM